MRRAAYVVVALAACALAAQRANAQSSEDAWALPPAGSCRPAPAGSGDEDARAFPFRSGEAVTADRMASLARFLPRAVWELRDSFFHEGMRLEVGPCFRDYGPPAFFQEATARGGARLTSDGGLEGYRAGLPFPAASIARTDPQAGAKWAWNAALRYQGAGFRGKFRMTDLSEGTGDAEPYEGEIFRIFLTHRADLEKERVDGADDLWIAGGHFTAPFNAREFAWRQYHSEESLRDATRSDDLRAYLPQQRRVRRLPAANVDGVFVPAYSVGAVPDQQLAIPAGGGLPAVSGGVGLGGGGGGGSAGGGAGAGSTSVGGTAVDVGADVEGSRTGFDGLAFRPNAWDWKLVGVEDVIAPIHIATPVYPESPDRNFGPSGLALADRWELRRALVLEAKRKPDQRESTAGGPANSPRRIWYFDLQTLVPLYSIDVGADGGTLGVAIHAGRWSEDRAGYPRWPDDPNRPVRVLDSVAAVYATPDRRGSWRRESWDFVSTPPPEKELEHMRSITSITQGR